MDEQVVQVSYSNHTTYIKNEWMFLLDIEPTDYRGGVVRTLKGSLSPRTELLALLPVSL